MLAGSFTQEDEDSVLAELEAITQVGLITVSVCVCVCVCLCVCLCVSVCLSVCVCVNVWLKQTSALRMWSSSSVSSCVSSVSWTFRETWIFPRFLQTSCQTFQRKRRRSQVRSLRLRSPQIPIRCERVRGEAAWTCDQHDLTNQFILHHNLCVCVCVCLVSRRLSSRRLVLEPPSCCTSVNLTLFFFQSENVPERNQSESCSPHESTPPSSCCCPTLQSHRKHTGGGGA